MANDNDTLRVPLPPDPDGIRRFLGYVTIRRKDDGYHISTKLPGMEYESVRADTKSQAVQVLYSAFRGYIYGLLHDVDTRLLKLPKQEYFRSGFRKGWLLREKSQLEKQKAELLKSSKNIITHAINRLKEKGWPTPPTPSMPWETVNVKEASTHVWLGRGGPQPLRKAADEHQASIEDIRRKLPFDSEDSPQSQRTHTWLRLLARLKPTALHQIAALPVPVARPRSPNGTAACAVSAEIPHQPRARTSDSGETPHPHGQKPATEGCARPGSHEESQVRPVEDGVRPPPVATEGEAGKAVE